MAKPLTRRTQELKEALEMLQLTIYHLEYQRDNFGIDDKKECELNILYGKRFNVQNNLNSMARGIS